MNRTISEFELISRLGKGAPRHQGDLIQGIGDDCAVIKSKDKWELVTTDGLCENVHFKTDHLSYEDLGYKSLAINLSDIAAMGGSPKYHVVTISIPKDRINEAEKIYAGMNEAAKEFGSILIGGDTASSLSDIFISITAIGEIKPKRCVFRQGAKPGDAIFVTGKFGGAALGLALLDDTTVSRSSFIDKLRRPKPQLAIGRFLAEQKIASSMIDVSDGLIADLGHISDASNVGFKINVDLIPNDRELPPIAKSIGLDPDELKLSGGEDYELVFTAPPEKIGALEKRKDVTRIGRILELPSNRFVVRNGNEIAVNKKGFDHFSK